MSAVSSLQCSREGNHIALGKPKLSGASCHAGKRLEKKVRRVGPVNARNGAADMKVAVFELELGNDLHEDCRIAHLGGLSARGLGGSNLYLTAVNCKPDNSLISVQP